MSLPEGLFWKEVPKKVKEKAVAPEPFWLEPDYEPPYSYEPYQLMTDNQIRKAAEKKEILICDIELYPNYFMAAFMSIESGKVIIIEDEMEKLNWILHNFQIVTFNGNHFDVPIMTLAIAGKSIDELKYAADMLIVHGNKGWQVLKSFNVPALDIDHIDIIEVCPLKGSLKIYGGRIHTRRIQDLPFQPESDLTPKQIEILKNYCINDLITTACIFSELSEQLSIRKAMSDKYGVDLRSKSDAQIAEAVFKAELKRMGTEAKIPNILPGTIFRYKLPPFVSFKSDDLKQLLQDICDARFVVNEKGSIRMPDELVDPKCRKFKIAKKRKGRVTFVGKNGYRMGIGGLHSCEENVSYVSNNEFVTIDRDVASYYPALILNQNLYPKHLGPNFLNVYRSLVSRRLKAKKEKDKVAADMMKIVINGCFGKLGSKYSIFYSPDLLIQTTITGQLCLLMLIEMLNDEGIQVCSANTDGIVVRFPRVMKDKVDSIFKQWEEKTKFETEETPYQSIHIRDVNSYIAIKPDGSYKLKGAYSIGEGIFRFHKNPTNPICVEAAVQYILKGTPVSDTIKKCDDFTKFLTIRAVKGGAVKDKTYLGKAVRWYYSRTTAGEIVYASNGNKVPKSENAKPCMDLPDEFPDDIDYARYESEALEILKQIAVL